MGSKLWAYQKIVGLSSCADVRSYGHYVVCLKIYLYTLQFQMLKMIAE